MAAGSDAEPGAFFICTETSPRCYIIQRVNASSVDRMMSDLQMQSSDYETPPTPELPWWFTPECESQLLTASEPVASLVHSPVPPAPLRPSPPSLLPPRPEQIKLQLKAQLEYYFSRENLMTDRFLRSQMDNDQYVPIRIIAGFPKVKRLTSEFSLIVQVLRESPHLQVDETGERVRAVSKRCTIILREIPESTDEKEVASMFAGGPPYISLRYGLNNSWYVTFESEEATQRAFLHLQNLGKTFNNKPICARIKTGGAPCSDPLLMLPERVPSAATSESITDIPVSIPSAHSPSSSDNFDLGQILASYGYVPRATFKPGATVVQVTSTVNFAGNRANGHRARGGHSGHYRGSSSRGRGGCNLANGSLNQREFNGHREYNNSNYRGHHGGGRRGNNHSELFRDGYRDRSDSFRPRGRSNRPNSFSNGTGISRSRTPVEPHKLAYHNDMRQRSASDYEQMHNRSKRDLLNVDASYTGSRNNLSPPIICTPEDEKKAEERKCSSITNDDSKSESSSRKTEDAEYNFEEGAFPSLLEEAKEVKVAEPEKPRERPSFSMVAAGRRKEKKETKEKRSYAQTLKQNNG